MLQIGDTLISLDVIERDFICNLSACRGSCCTKAIGSADYRGGAAGTYGVAA